MLSMRPHKIYFDDFNRFVDFNYAHSHASNYYFRGSTNILVENDQNGG